MGLTIHYKLATKLTSPRDVRQLVETMRQFALDLPFQEVSDIKEFKGEDIEDGSRDDPDRWLKIQAGAYLEADRRVYTVTPKHIIAFETQPGEGSEPANFGFCKFPAFIPGHEGKRVATKLSGWRWKSFCKTQYASDPKCGGVENFLRCHLSIVKLLDFIQKSELVTVEVSDEGRYWEDRNLEALVKEIGDWNVFIAGMTSVIRSQAEGMTVEAPITGFPNFEHLEAKGLDMLADLHRRLKKPEAEN